MLRTAACTPAVAVLQDGHFALHPFEETADIFLVCQQYKQCYRNSKHSVNRIVNIEYNENEYRESDTGKYRTQ